VDSSKKNNKKLGNMCQIRYWWTVQRNITGNQEKCDRLDTFGQFRETL
jgi:hypothetical protein